MRNIRTGESHTPHGHYINGDWTWSTAGGFADVVNPANEEIVAEVWLGGAGDVEHACRAAADALPDWSATSWSTRALYLRTVAEGLERRKEEIATMIAREVGMPIKLASKIQATLPVETFARTADLLEHVCFEQPILNSNVSMHPVGVVAAITPWNYPLHQIAAKVAPALAAGCTVVLKPSEIAPSVATTLAEVVYEAGVPSGVFNLVNGDGACVGDALVTNEHVAKVSFTGSSATGKQLAQRAGYGLKRLSLELGGKSASLILPEAAVRRAVQSTINSCFLNSGQTCNALTRLIVPDYLSDQVAEIAREIAGTFRVGDPFDPETRMGPVISAAQRERIRSYVDQAVAEGAQLITETDLALPNRGFYMAPTVLQGVQPNARVAQEEIFGPVLCIINVRDEREAIHVANSTPYGLAAAVWTNDKERALDVAQQLEAGQVYINDARFNPLAPFGGVKQSGYGRELGIYGIKEFLEPKSVQV